jgi:uncharacterized repeat protein (TIGR01451 family)
MTYRISLLALCVLAAPAAAQVPPVVVGTPLQPVRFVGPEGMHATFYQGRPEGRDFEAPVNVGMRTGYIYRVKLSGMTQFPGVELYPSLEVRGCIQLPPRMNPGEHPAPVVLTDDDIQKALDGTLITKVVYLEDPNKAASLSWKQDQPPEGVLPPDRDPWADAWSLGRPLIIVRLGERQLSPQELVWQSIAGTILLPGERTLMPPRYPPCIPLATPAFYDPRLGRKSPEEECLHDGGDRGDRAGFDGTGQLHGVDPEDTVAEYTDGRGRKSVVCSNRICICVPRYAVLRTDLALARSEVALGPGDTRGVTGQSRLEARQPSIQTKQYEIIAAMNGRERPSATVNKEGLVQVGLVEVLNARVVTLGFGLTVQRFGLDQLTEIQRLQFRRQVEFALQLSQREGLSGFEQKIGTAVVGRVVGGPQVITAEIETRDYTVICKEKPEVIAPDKPLCLRKWADRDTAQVGDVVTIILRYSNQGNRPITDVALTDSLTGRLEYVSGSSDSDRDAVFTARPNEAGSLMLHWEISGTLQPGESGVVKFQVRIR